MDRSSPSRVAGIVIREVKLADRVFVLSQPDKVRKAADEEAVIISRRLDMLGAMVESCARLSPDIQELAMQQYIRAMTNGIASPQEWESYYNSPWKLAFDFWTALDPKEKLDPQNRTGNTERTLLAGVRWCYELLSSNDATNEQIKALRLAIRIVSQRDQVGNSSGPNVPQDSQSTVAPSTVVT